MIIFFRLKSVLPFKERHKFVSTNWPFIIWKAIANKFVCISLMRNGNIPNGKSAYNLETKTPRLPEWVLHWAINYAFLLQNKFVEVNDKELYGTNMN